MPVVLQTVSTAHTCTAVRTICRFTKRPSKFQYKVRQHSDHKQLSKLYYYFQHELSLTVFHLKSALQLTGDKVCDVVQMSGHLNFVRCGQAEVAEFCIHCCDNPRSSLSAGLLQNYIITQVQDLQPQYLGLGGFLNVGLVRNCA